MVNEPIQLQQENINPGEAKVVISKKVSNKVKLSANTNPGSKKNEKRNSGIPNANVS